MKCYYRPIPTIGPASADSALRLAGGWVWYDQVECITRDGASRFVSPDAVPEPIRSRLTAARPALAGCAFDQPRLMGIVNVTPDSFSDGGRFSASDAAIAHAQALVQSGADVLDIGGESTRPGAVEVPVQDEIDRVVPVVAGLRAKGLAAAISIDTRKAAVARAALQAGADVINDVSAFRFDSALGPLAAEQDAPVILMHSLATPETMQNNPHYGNVLLDIYDALEAAIAEAEAFGIPRARIVIDPGIGFGKTDSHNRALLSRISLFHALGCPILLGVSRKGFIGRIANISEADKRDAGSAALGLWAVSQGVQILRVHDIAIHRQMIALWQATTASEREE